MRLLFRLGAAFLFGLVMLVVHWSSPGQFLEREYGLPLLYSLRGDLPAPPEAIVIGLDNGSVRAMNAHFGALSSGYSQGHQAWPLLDDCLPDQTKQSLRASVNINQLPRAVHGCLLDVLAARNARVIVFDISFSQSRPGDAFLGAAISGPGMCCCSNGPADPASIL